LSDIHDLEKIINNINIKKATGADGIPAKIIKCSKSIIAPQITSILNMSIDQNVFPDKLKKAQVTPLYCNRLKNLIISQIHGSDVN
jgi:hypothetical protein